MRTRQLETRTSARKRSRQDEALPVRLASATVIEGMARCRHLAPFGPMPLCPEPAAPAEETGVERAACLENYRAKVTAALKARDEAAARR